MIAKKFSKRFWLDVVDNAGETGAFVLDLTVKLLMLGFIGGALITFGPLVLNAPTVIGGVFANWCVSRGACDLSTNLFGLGLGVYLFAGILVFVLGAFNWNPQSLDEDVLDAIRRAGDTGITAAKISRLTDIERGDVEGILTNLLDESEIVTISATPPLYRPFNETDKVAAGLDQMIAERKIVLQSAYLPDEDGE